jgi:SNF2 family DNA or RNA helicase
VEERSLELQDRKRAPADAILDAGAGGLRGLQREDLERLLSSGQRYEEVPTHCASA